jgi:hypothetical protein
MKAFHRAHNLESGPRPSRPRREPQALVWLHHYDQAMCSDLAKPNPAHRARGEIEGPAEWWPVL